MHGDLNNMHGYLSVVIDENMHGYLKQCLQRLTPQGVLFYQFDHFVTCTFCCRGAQTTKEGQTDEPTT